MNQSFSHLVGILVVMAELVLLVYDPKLAAFFAVVCGAILTWNDLTRRSQGEQPLRQLARDLTTKGE